MYEWRGVVCESRERERECISGGELCVRGEESMRAAEFVRGGERVCEGKECVRG